MVIYKAPDFSKLTEINDELDNLQHGDVLLPPDADTTGTLEVVPVHDNVDQQVDGDGNPLHSSQTNQLSVAKQSSSTVVVGVEEGQGLLLEDKKDGVEELDVFVDVVQLCEWQVLVAPIVQSSCARQCDTYVVQDNQRLSPSTAVVADGVEDTVADNGGQELLNKQSQEDGADGGQEEVVDHEQSV